VEQEEYGILFFMNYLIVGLGNPGKEYENTRHNAGVMVLEQIRSAWDFPDWSKDSMSNSLMSRGILDTEQVTFMFPQTFMNLSGTAVRHYADAEYTQKLVVIYDDLDIPLGQIKMSYDRSSGGHNGVQSIIDTLGGSDFARIRIGIGPVEGDIREHVGVLDVFSDEERKVIESQSKKVAEVLKVFFSEGKEKAMTLANTAE
jgi:PTH1 family peptidyl-tRNA hydrolase